MEKELHSTTPYLTPSDMPRLQARLTSFITWLAPAWATLCGAVASSSFDWQGENRLKLALLVLLVDVGWGILWAVAGHTDWATPLHRWRDWQTADPIAIPPYTLPDSPGDRTFYWLGQLRAWWRTVFWPSCGLSFTAVIVALLVIVILGALLGENLLLLNVAALAVMQLGVAWEGGRGVIGPKWDTVISIALPWLSGHVAFSEGIANGWAQYASSIGLALAFALAWGAAWRADSGWERLLGTGAQLLTVVFLIALRAPLAAAGLLALLVPQLMLLPWMRRGQPASWYVRHTRPWLMVAMLVAAWALQA